MGQGETLNSFWDEQGLEPFEPDHGHCRLSLIESVDSITVDAVRQVNQEQILVSATAHAHAILNVNADWEDYQAYADVREFFPVTESEGPFSFADADFAREARSGFHSHSER